MKNNKKEATTEDSGLSKFGEELVASRRKLKRFLAVAICTIVIVGGCAGCFVFSSATSYFSTDNAKVTAKMYNIMPVTTGKLLEWNVEVGDAVEQNQILGRQEILPYITAPINGTVVKNDGAVNQLVSPSTSIAVVADSDNMYIGVNIEETDIVKIKVGQDAKVKLDAYPGKTFQGRVTEIDQTTQTFFSSASSFSTSGTYTKITQLVPIKIVIDNPDNLPLTFGMNAEVKIHLKTKDLKMPQQTEKTKVSSKADKAVKTVEMIPSVSGKIAAVNVAEGQNVKAGQVLFTLDSTDYELQLKQAAGSLDAAKAALETAQASKGQNTVVIPAKTNYDDAKVNYDRVQQLYGEGAVSKQEMEGAKSKLDIAAAQLDSAEISQNASYDSSLAQVESAKAAYDIAKKRVADCTVTAPIDGTVYKVNAESGSFASAQTAVMVIQGN